MTGRGEAPTAQEHGPRSFRSFNSQACAEFCGQRQRRLAYGPMRKLSSGCPEVDPLYGAGLSQNGKANRDPPDIVGINQASLDLLHRRIRRQASDYHGQFTCGIDPYGTIGRDLVPHPVHIGLEPPTWARPGANGTVADRSEPGSYRFPDTPTFTLDVDIRPEATGW
jgi:hypothetical protein